MRLENLRQASGAASAPRAVRALNPRPVLCYADRTRGRKIVAVILAASLVGCVTFNNVVEPFGGEQFVYGGTAAAGREVARVARESEPAWVVPGVPLSAADVPLSLVGDTLTLPITIAAASSRWMYLVIDAHYFPAEREDLSDERTGGLTPRRSLDFSPTARPFPSRSPRTTCSQ